MIIIRGEERVILAGEDDDVGTAGNRWPVIAHRAHITDKIRAAAPTCTQWPTPPGQCTLQD